MELKKVTQATEKVEENVLTISEKEFKEVATDVVETMLKKDRANGADPMIYLALTLSYAALMGSLHKRLFRQEEIKE